MDQRIDYSVVILDSKTRRTESNGLFVNRILHNEMRARTIGVTMLASIKSTQ
jgi:hypothetical protein